MTGKRSNTRLAAVKALYASEINDIIDGSKTPDEITLDIISYYNDNGEDVGTVELDEKFLSELVRGVCGNMEILDEKIIANLGDGWKIKRLGAIIRSVLRAGIYELMNFPDTPFKVIIDEYVNITRSFFDDKEVGFVNGLLDKVAKEVRGGE